MFIIVNEHATLGNDMAQWCVFKSFYKTLQLYGTDEKATAQTMDTQTILVSINSLLVLVLLWVYGLWVFWGGFVD